MDAEQRRGAVIGEVLRHRLVGEQHELLDQAMGDVALRGEDGRDAAGFVQHQLVFGQVEVDRAAPPPARVQHLEQLAHQLEQRNELRILLPGVGVLLREDGVDGGVGHPLVAVDDAVVQLVADHVALGVDLHQARLHEAIDLRVERAQPGRQLVREHVHGALGEVDRGAALVASRSSALPSCT